MSKSICYFFLPVLILFIFSCKKKTPEDIGLPLLPGQDILNAAFTDTTTIIAHTVKDDSLSTDWPLVMLLGNINDPVFGITKSSIYTQLSLSKINPSFGKNPVLDSAVLSLVYNNGQYYGTLSKQKFTVHELAEKLSVDSSHYEYSTLLYNTELASAYLTPKVKYSVKLGDNVKYPAHLRLTLNKSFFQNFFKDTTFYDTDKNFQDHFKGLYISTSSGSPSGQGAILGIALTNSYSRLSLYYHNDKEDSLSYFFGISSQSAARFSHFDHDYSLSTDIMHQLNTADNIPENKVYIQPMAGVKAKIYFPYIKDYFKNGKIAINKAELILPVDRSSVSSVFSAHPKFVLVIADSAHGSLTMQDSFEPGFGGEYDTTNMVYKFNIARYIQQVLNGTRKNQGLYIAPNTRIITANRVVLLGGDKANLSRMRLKITYTPIE